ncbi:hypothetical protein ABZY42_30515 [Streptomyces sp. NPDC006622]|uniref:hypothetical protein n=1 Tax=Streptomyces sp. NPDC006622 TaxID=3155459 RepID=UPI0033B2DDB1
MAVPLVPLVPPALPVRPVGLMPPDRSLVCGLPPVPPARELSHRPVRSAGRRIL